MKHSESIVNLAPALVLAQGSMEAAANDGNNPAFKSRYATLAAVVEAARPALSENGLAVLQFTHVNPADKLVTVTTRILHKSAEWIEDELSLPVDKWTAQGIGSGLTYGKRYGYCAMLGVVSEDVIDDDGAAASRVQNVEAPEGFERWLDDLSATAENGTPALEAMWKASAKPFKDYLTKTENARWSGLKDKASKVAAA